MAEPSAAPLSMALFDLIVSLCTTFPSLNPLSIREYEALEVIGLINKMTRKGRLAETPGQPKKARKRVYADQVNWF